MHRPTLIELWTRWIEALLHFCRRPSPHGAEEQPDEGQAREKVDAGAAGTGAASNPCLRGKPPGSFAVLRSPTEP